MRNDYATLRGEYGEPLVKTDILMNTGQLMSELPSDSGVIRNYDHYDFPELAQQSDLSKMGYSVGQQSNLSDKERQRILTDVIASGRKTKGWVCSYLKYMIKMRRNSERNWLAVQKWKQDLEFVQALDESSLQTTYVLNEPKRLTIDELLADDWTDAEMNDDLPF